MTQLPYNSSWQIASIKQGLEKFVLYTKLWVAHTLALMRKKDTA